MKSDRGARLSRVGQDLRTWADRFSLPRQHIDRAAYYTVVSTPLELPFGRVTALAETIFWIYVFDDFLDRRSATEESLPQVDQDLRLITAALSPGLYISPIRTRRRPHLPATLNLLDELQALIASAGLAGRQPERRLREPLTDGESEASTAGIRDALASLLAHLENCWRDLSTRPEARQFRGCLVRRQIARCMASMRREFEWNVRLAGQLELPSLDMYMMTGSVSIGMHAVAAVAASYERDAERAWRKNWAAIDTAGRIIRLANDLATYPRELAEGKLTSLTLVLDQPGHIEMDEAADVIRQSLHQLTGFFAYVGRSPSEWEVLPFYLRHVVAFAVAAYREEEEGASAAD